MTGIYNKLINIIESQCKTFSEHTILIKHNDSLTTDIGFDTLDLLELIAKIESTFKIELHDINIENMTVEELYNYIASLMQL